MIDGAREISEQSTKAQQAIKKIVSPQERLGMDKTSYSSYKARFTEARTAIQTMTLDGVIIKLSEFKMVEQLNPDHYASGGSIRERATLNNHLYVVKKLTDNEIQEFIAAPLFRRALCSRAPKISLVQDFGIASKFFHHRKFFHSLYDYRKQNTNLEYALTEYEGIELIIAAAMRFGDIDAISQNILTDKLETPNGLKKRLLKIDHGWALTTFFTNEGEMRQAFFRRFAEYIPYINLRRLKEAILFCCSISDEEIEDMVKRQIYFLKKQKNLKPPFEFTIGINDELGPKNDSSFYSTIQFLTLDGYEKFILERLKKQGEVLRQCLTSLHWIWIIGSGLYDSGKIVNLFASLDPLVWALQNNIYIGGLPPITFINENKLLNSYIIRYLVDKYQSDTNLLKTLLQPPKELVNDTLLIFLLDNNLNIHDKNPLVYAVENGLVTEELARHAAEKKFKINGVDAFEYGVQHNMVFKGLHPIVYALSINFEINGMHPFEFLDFKKHGHNHPSIFIELISDNCYAELWQAELYLPKLMEVAKFALKHGLDMYEKNAIEFLESVGVCEIAGIEIAQWAQLNKENNKKSVTINIGVASQIQL